MAKKIKLNLEKSQLAKIAGLDKLKAKLAGEKVEKKTKRKSTTTTSPAPVQEEEQPRRIRARNRSAFAPKEELTAEPPQEEKASSDRTRDMFFVRMLTRYEARMTLYKRRMTRITE